MSWFASIQSDLGLFMSLSPFESIWVFLKFGYYYHQHLSNLVTVKISQTRFVRSKKRVYIFVYVSFLDNYSKSDTSKIDMSTFLDAFLCVDHGVTIRLEYLLWYILQISSTFVIQQHFIHRFIWIFWFLNKFTIIIIHLGSIQGFLLQDYIGLLWKLFQDNTIW